MGLDTVAKQVMTQIVSDLLHAVRDKGWQDPCIAAMMPGLEVPLDYCSSGACGGGMIWAQLISVDPVLTEAAGTGIPCVSGYDGTFSVGIVSAAPIATQDGDEILLPEAGDHILATELQMEQMQMILTTITCPTVPFPMGRGTAVAYGPVGPQGGCVGGAWVVRIPLT